MKRRLSDPEVQMLAEIAATLESKHSDEAREKAWAGSPFHWIQRQKSGRIAKIGKELLTLWCEKKGLMVALATGKGADLVIEGHRVRLKRATLSKGRYIFEQIRRDDEFEYLVCFGLSPFQAHCWVIPKDVVLNHAAVQHGPRTKWITFSPADPPAWLRAYGGTLSEAFTVLQQLARR